MKRKQLLLIFIVGIGLLALPAGRSLALSNDELVSSLKAEVVVLQTRLIVMLRAKLADLQKRLAEALVAQLVASGTPSLSATSTKPIAKQPPFVPVTLIGSVAEGVASPLATESHWQPVARFRFSSTYDAYKVTDLFVKNAPNDALAVDSSADSSISELALIDEGGVIKDTAVLVAGRAHFAMGKDLDAQGLGAVYVPFNSSVLLTLAIKVNPITRANDTGKLIRFVVDSGTSGGAIVESTSTGQSPMTLSVQGSDTPIIVLRKAKLSISSNSQTLAENSLITDTPIAVYRFTVSANGDSDIAWKGVKFTVTGRVGGRVITTTTGAPSLVTTGDADFGFGVTDITPNISRFALYGGDGREVAGGNYVIQLDWDTVKNTGEVAVVLASGYEEQIVGSSSKVYELRARVTGAIQSGDNITVYLRPEANDKRTNDYLVEGASPDGVDGSSDGFVRMTAHGAITPYSFLWSDLSGTPHSAENSFDDADSKDWTNDRFLRINVPSWTRSLN